MYFTPVYIDPERWCKCASSLYSLHHLIVKYCHHLLVLPGELNLKLNSFHWQLFEITHNHCAKFKFKKTMARPFRPRPVCTDLLSHCVASDNGVSFPEMSRIVLRSSSPFNARMWHLWPKISARTHCVEQQWLIHKIQIAKLFIEESGWPQHRKMPSLDGEGFGTSNIGTSINVKHNNPPKKGN